MSHRKFFLPIIEEVWKYRKKNPIERDEFANFYVAPCMHEKNYIFFDHNLVTDNIVLALKFFYGGVANMFPIFFDILLKA